MEILICFIILIVIATILGVITTITEHNLLKKIHANPEHRDDLIDSYWAKDFLDSDFYEKCKTPSEKFQQELEDLSDDAYDINDFIAVEKYSELFAKRKKSDEHKSEIAEAKRHQENSQKLELLANKASQALDDVWD